MPKNGALPNAGIGVSLQNSFNTRSIRVGTSNNASDSSKQQKQLINEKLKKGNTFYE